MYRSFRQTFYLHKIKTNPKINQINFLCPPASIWFSMWNHSRCIWHFFSKKILMEKFFNLQKSRHSNIPLLHPSPLSIVFYQFLCASEMKKYLWYFALRFKACFLFGQGEDRLICLWSQNNTVIKSYYISSSNIGVGKKAYPWKHKTTSLYCI